MGKDKVDSIAGTITKHGKSATGHGFWVLTRDNGEVITIGRYPKKPRFDDKIVPGTVSFTVPATDAQIDAILNGVGQGRYLGVAGNCIDGLEWGLEILGIEHPSFDILGVSAPPKAIIWIESLNGKDTFKQGLEQDLKFVTDPDLFWPAVRPSPTVIKPGLSCSIKPAGDLGGVSLDRTAQMIGSFSDIVGATYDFSTGQLILIGTQNYSLPPMDFDDFAVAVRSIYGLGGKPPQSPGVSIDWNSENNAKIKKNKLKHLYSMPVHYEGVTENTHFGQVMFEADRVLKCLILGKDNISGNSFRAGVPGYKSLPERYSDPHMKLNSESMLENKMWFVPKEIQLIKSPNGQSMIFGQVEMEVLTETLRKQKRREDAAAESFASHFTSHFDEFARQYPILEELKRLGKITGIVKWLKENDVPIDLSLFNDYTPRYVPTVFSTPAMVSYLKGIVHGPFVGGVAYHLSESNFHEFFGDKPGSLQESAIRSRPSEDVMEWDVAVLGNGFKAAAHTIERTRKIGNIQKTFVDMRFPVPGNNALEFIRYYNSFNDRDCGFGRGWELSPASLHFPRKRIGIKWITTNLITEVFPEIFVFEEGSEYSFMFYGLDTQSCPIYTSERNSDFLIEHEDGRFVLHKETGTSFFDPLGKLIQKNDGQGTSFFFSYDADRLVSIAHQNGKKIQIEYENERIVRVGGPGGKTVYYQYNEDRQLKAVADQLGNIAFYEYDSEKNLSAMHDANRRIVFAASYDHYHRATSVTKGKASKERQFSLKDHAAKIQGPNNSTLYNSMINSLTLVDHKIGQEKN